MSEIDELRKELADVKGMMVLVMSALNIPTKPADKSIGAIESQAANAVDRVLRRKKNGGTVRQRGRVDN